MKTRRRSSWIVIVCSLVGLAILATESRSQTPPVVHPLGTLHPPGKTLPTSGTTPTTNPTMPFRGVDFNHHIVVTVPTNKQTSVNASNCAASFAYDTNPTMPVFQWVVASPGSVVVHQDSSSAYYVTIVLKPAGAGTIPNGIGVISVTVGTPPIEITPIPAGPIVADPCP